MADPFFSSVNDSRRRYVNSSKILMVQRNLNRNYNILSQGRLLRDIKKIKSVNSNEKQFDTTPLSKNKILFLGNARFFGPSETI